MIRTSLRLSNNCLKIKYTIAIINVLLSCGNASAWDNLLAAAASEKTYEELEQLYVDGYYQYFLAPHDFVPLKQQFEQKLRDSGCLLRFSKDQRLWNALGFKKDIDRIKEIGKKMMGPATSPFVLWGPDDLMKASVVFLPEIPQSEESLLSLFKIKYGFNYSVILKKNESKDTNYRTASFTYASFEALRILAARKLEITKEVYSEEWSNRLIMIMALLFQQIQNPKVNPWKLVNPFRGEPGSESKTAWHLKDVPFKNMAWYGWGTATEAMEKRLENLKSLIEEYASKQFVVLVTLDANNFAPLASYRDFELRSRLNYLADGDPKKVLLIDFVCSEKPVANSHTVCAQWELPLERTNTIILNEPLLKKMREEADKRYSNIKYYLTYADTIRNLFKQFFDVIQDGTKIEVMEALKKSAFFHSMPLATDDYFWISQVLLHYLLHQRGMLSEYNLNKKSLAKEALMEEIELLKGIANVDKAKLPPDINKHVFAQCFLQDNNKPVRIWFWVKPKPVQDLMPMLLSFVYEHVLSGPQDERLIIEEVSESAPVQFLPMSADLLRLMASEKARNLMGDNWVENSMLLPQIEQRLSQFYERHLSKRPDGFVQFDFIGQEVLSFKKIKALHLEEELIECVGESIKLENSEKTMVIKVPSLEFVPSYPFHMYQLARESINKYDQFMAMRVKSYFDIQDGVCNLDAFFASYVQNSLKEFLLKMLPKYDASNFGLLYSLMRGENWGVVFSSDELKNEISKKIEEIYFH